MSILKWSLIGSLKVQSSPHRCTQETQKGEVRNRTPFAARRVCLWDQKQVNVIVFYKNL